MRQAQHRRNPEACSVTAEGYPWDPDVPLYHATTGLRSILRSGFRTRRELGGMNALGGGPTGAVSLTADPRVALSIVQGLLLLQMVGQGRIGLRELVAAGAHDIGGGPMQKALGAWAAGSIGAAWNGKTWDYDWPVTEAVENHTKIERPKWPGGRGPDGQSTLRKMTRTEVAKAGYDLYRAILSYGEEAKRAYNPLFFGTDVEAIAKLDTRDIGILTVRVPMRRMLADPMSAVHFGYLTRAEAQFAPTNQDHGFHFERGEPARVPPPGYYTYKKLGPFNYYPTEGKPTAEGSGILRESLAEIRVYAPRQIEVLDAQPVDDLGGALDVQRITFPFFTEFDPPEAPPGAYWRWRCG